jgi:hypothetical protein
MYRLLTAALRRLSESPSSAAFSRAAALLSTVAKARSHLCRRRCVPPLTAVAAPQVKCFIPMLDLEAADELAVELLSACLETVRCALSNTQRRRERVTSKSVMLS